MIAASHGTFFQSAQCNVGKQWRAICVCTVDVIRLDVKIIITEDASNDDDSDKHKTDQYQQTDVKGEYKFGGEINLGEVRS